MEIYRTFVALPVKVGERFLKRRDELIDALGGERISWVDPKRFHVTLRFLGDTEEREVEAIGNALREQVILPPVTRLKLDRLGSFGPRKKPRVVWVGFEDPGLFESLKGAVDHALESCGIPTSDQLFRAHLTLGRVRSLKNMSRFYQVVGEMEEQFRVDVAMERMVFYRSELKTGGPVYTPLIKLEFRTQTF